MSASTSTVAGPTCHDCKIGSQFDRMLSRPLTTTDPDLASFSSLQGRLVSLVELGHTLVREPYRAFKNLLLVIQKIYEWVRMFFETLFGEHTWGEFGAVSEDLGSTLVALPMRAATWFMDLSKLFAGIFVPAAAISTETTPP